MNADEVAQRISGGSARKSGGAWAVLCPAHADRNPSLTISDGNDGRVLVKCHAGCTYDDVLAAAGLEARDLRPERKQADRQIDRTYAYTDEDGEILFEVVRFVPKDFRQRRPDGKGGWIWSLGDTRRVLYRLPEVIDAVRRQESFFIVEGEKDAEAIRRYGDVATCNPGGAGKWRPEYTDGLKGARAIIVADRDEVGYKHAREVAAALATVAAEVSIVEPLEGKDVSDHLAAGHSLEELVVVDDAQVAPAVPTIAPVATRAVTGDDWPDVVPLNADVPVPAFPVEALPPVMREMVEAVAGSTATPVDFPATIALGAFAALASRGINVRASDYEAPVNLYVTGVLPVGEGKSPVMRALSGELWKIESEWDAAAAEEIGRAETLRSIEEKKVDKAIQQAAAGTIHEQEAIDARSDADAVLIPNRPRIVAKDATPEAIIKICGRNGGTLAIINDEGAEAFTVASRYSSTGTANLGPLLTGFDGDPFVADRATKDTIRIDRLVLSSVLCIQPGVLDDLAKDRSNRDRGVLARFLLTFPESNVGYRVSRRPPIPAVVQEEWNGTLRWLAEKVATLQGPMVIEFDHDAYELFLDWQEVVEARMRPDEGDLHQLNDWANKSRAHCLRLAAIVHLAANRGKGTASLASISKESVEAAITLWTYYAEHAKRVFIRMAEPHDSRVARKCLRWIRNHQRTSFKFRDLHRAVNGGIVSNKEDVQAALLLLIGNGYVRRLRTSDRTEAYAVNPAALGDEARGAA